MNKLELKDFWWWSYRSFVIHHTNIFLWNELPPGGSVGMARVGTLISRHIKWIFSNNGSGLTYVIEEMLQATFVKVLFLIQYLRLTICSFLANSAAPILCTGASPHRYLGISIENYTSKGLIYIPRNKIHLSRLRSRKIWNRLHRAKDQDQLFQSCSRLKGMRIWRI